MIVVATIEEAAEVEVGNEAEGGVGAGLQGEDTSPEVQGGSTETLQEGTTEPHQGKEINILVLFDA